MAGWDFTIDSEKQNELAVKLDKAADNFDDKVALLYEKIDSMDGTSWIGDDYNAFNSGAHGYENALKDLSNGFRMFGEHFKLMSKGTEVLATELIDIINNMTGTNGGGTGGNDYSGDGTTPSTGGNHDEGETGSGTWTRYIDALNAGYGDDVITSAEFDRAGGKVGNNYYTSYESYLEAMYDKHMNGGNQDTDAGAYPNGEETPNYDPAKEAIERNEQAYANVKKNYDTLKNEVLVIKGFIDGMKDNSNFSTLDRSVFDEIQRTLLDQIDYRNTVISKIDNEEKVGMNDIFVQIKSLDDLDSYVNSYVK